MPSATHPIWQSALALAAFLGLAGCYPHFASAPAGTPAQTGALAGAWTLVSDNAPKMTMGVTLGDVEGTFSAVLHETAEAPADDDLMLNGSVIEQGGVKYAAFRDAKDPAGTGMMLARYTLEGDTLIVDPALDTKVTEAIQSGALAGKVEGEGQGAQIDVTADADALGAFLATPQGQALFDNRPEGQLKFTRAAAGK